MAAMKEYEVVINGISHTLLLDPEDAERYGETAVVLKVARPLKPARD